MHTVTLIARQLVIMRDMRIELRCVILSSFRNLLVTAVTFQASFRGSDLRNVGFSCSFRRHTCAVALITCDTNLEMFLRKCVVSLGLRRRKGRNTYEEKYGYAK